MTRIILESKNNGDLQLIKELAERLNINYKIQSLPEKDSNKSAEYYYSVIEKGADVSNYGDPSQWQKKIRGNRSIKHS